MNLNVLALFAGIGGLELAVGIVRVFAVRLEAAERADRPRQMRLRVHGVAAHLDVDTLRVRSDEAARDAVRVVVVAVRGADMAARSNARGAGGDRRGVTRAFTSRASKSS